MKQVFYRIFTVAQAEQEEQWLNEQSAKGLQLAKVGFCRYVFEEGTPGEYAYRLQLMESGLNSKKSMDYLQFLREMGIEPVASILRWVYLRKKADGTPFELYSDLQSQADYYTRIYTLCSVVAALNALSAAINGIAVAVQLIERRVFPFAPNFIAMLLGLLVATAVYRFMKPLRQKIDGLKREAALRE